MKRLDDRGNVSIILVLIIVVLFGLMSYVVDIGYVYAQKIKLSNAIDAAVLAAALELPNDSEKAREIAEEYILKNEVALNEVEIIISDDNRSIEIIATRNVEHFFAPVMGIDSSTINTNTKAVIAPVKSVRGGIRPFAVEAFAFSYGETVTLKADTAHHGNYGTLALGGRGANSLKNNAAYGYAGEISIGDNIDTEPGNMSSVVNYLRNVINSDPYSFNNFERDSLRVWTVLLVDTLEVHGRASVLVVGFAQFFVEDIERKSGKVEITGRFIQYVINGEIDMTIADTGVYGVKLIR